MSQTAIPTLTGLVGRDNTLSIPVAALLASPLSLDGYAALPLVRALTDRGMAEGAATTYLISDGIICVFGPESTPVRAENR